MLVYTALGDSISWGLGAPLFYGYAYYIRDILKFYYPDTRFKNFSRPAATSKYMLYQLRINSKIRNAISNSSLITISIGGNNLLKGAKNFYRIVDEYAVQKWIIQFARDWPEILKEIRFNICYPGPIYIMTIYNPCRTDDIRYAVFDKYIDELNSIISDSFLISSYSYEIVDVYTHFEGNLGKYWTHFYDGRHNPHPNAEGHRQIALLHRMSMGI
ncbi:SGNH/GDSL hydrolase family protein [Fonticella tunisiensis]|uniref:Lysophospholipase L1-like esterase n=1 Tax=Fonticella tunisiensis TaxID=1096341 RepID=A0A4R7KKW8_9CLOT|nr:GDSL-type esterase/lipase family protein [Fonticella tunisiensis]TDT56481.1 lysophospholipase L1-like esterase [Fonticella tunisiensis]